MSDAKTTIVGIHARQILDSRGRPTVEAEVTTAAGYFGRASVPSGASTGRYEAVELRDGEPAHYGGLGVQRAVANVRTVIAPALRGLSVSDQAAIDRRLCELDGTANKGRLGANALLSVSLACAQAAAAAAQLPLWRYLDTEGHACLPLPMVNLISGGLHAGDNLDFQDFLLLPIGARSYSEALEMSVAVYRLLGEVLSEQGYDGRLVGDEGGYGPRLPSNEAAAGAVLRAIERAGLIPGRDAGLALDVAASHFYEQGRYVLASEGGRHLSSDEMVALLVRWSEQYPIFSIEDGLAETDESGWRSLTAALGDRVQLIGDDFFVTNPQRVQWGIAEKLANAVLVKVNQVGTLSEALQTLRLARQAGWRAVVSARSGETEDAFLADLAVASAAGQIKIGSVVRSERLAKYNQLLRIEEQMGQNAPFANWKR
jgi:enolase